MYHVDNIQFASPYYPSEEPPSIVMHVCIPPNPRVGRHREDYQVLGRSPAGGLYRTIWDTDRYTLTEILEAIKCST